MRTFEEYHRILSLWERGYNKKQIAKETGIPHATVRDCITRYGSVSKLLEEKNPSNTFNPDIQTLYRQILTLWEAGEPKIRIAKKLSVTRYIVMTCIEKYRTLAELERVIENGKQCNTEPHTIRPKNQQRYRYNEDTLRQAVADSYSYAQVLKLLGIKPAGGNYETLKRRIEQLQIDTSHFRGHGWNGGQRAIVTRKYRLEDVLIKNSPYKQSSSLKKRLIEAGYFEAICASCGLDTWLNHPIPLELDHINGDRRDNRLENLRLLCPNCHALTETYRGRNIKSS
ncbi:MAG: hypothetical protein Kow00117_09330 [Phototrophicales bacterium]